MTNIGSANLHITGRCNYHCGFCFDKNLKRSTMTPEEWEPILRKLKEEGVTKVNFAGGEPTMHPQFIELCRLTKSMGFTVSVISNGSRIDYKLIKEMKGAVDWIGLSVDSPLNEVEKVVGRCCKGINHIDNIIKVADTAHENGIKVKLNITVIRQSWKQDFSALIRRVNPERAKAFRVLRIEGENGDRFHEYSLTEEEWGYFANNHRDILLRNGEKVKLEDEDDMIDSYSMLDPRGRIMLNSENRLSFIPFDVIALKGLTAVVNAEKYHKRGAVYDWGSSL